MIIYTPKQLAELDLHTLKIKDISSLHLMETAANTATAEIIRLTESHVPVIILCGMGNNAGDGFAIARLLHQYGRKVEIIWLKYSKTLSPDAELNYKRLPPDIKLSTYTSFDNNLELPEQALYIDAVFGVGLNRALPEFISLFLKNLNKLSSYTIAIDVPSGLYAHKANQAEDVILECDICLSFHAPKLSFFMAENAAYIKSFKILDIGLVENHELQQASLYHYVDLATATQIFKPRTQFSHKGSFGHALLVGGNQGMSGSIILSAISAMRSGVGKLSVHSTLATNRALLINLPEAMTTGQSELLQLGHTNILNRSFDAIGLGMGFGRDDQSMALVSKILEYSDQSLLLDADALFAIAENEVLQHKIPKKSILTPHLGELKKIIGEWSNSYEMLDKVKAFSKRLDVVLVVKEAFTKIVYQDQVWVNSTGNPALATAGSGDCLSGIITSLLAQNHTPPQASILGVFLHGQAADIGLEHESPESFIASDIPRFLGEAFKLISTQQL